MNAPQTIPYVPEWPEPDYSQIAPETPPAPELKLDDVLTPRAAQWVSATAEGAGSSESYVFATLLAAAGAAIGNARWVSPWDGWSEPPILWVLVIGLPSSGKSPAIDAVLKLLRAIEETLRVKASVEHDEWSRKAEDAERALAVWDADARKALAKGNPAPERPQEADIGPEPHMPRLVISDATVERIAMIAQAQPKGFLQHRDEMAGLLRSMESRNGGSDRAFWLEAYGGRFFSQERMSRQPVSIRNLSVGMCGGIQPGPLNEILLKATDDGFLARMTPVWSELPDLRIPTQKADDTAAIEAFRKLVDLEMVKDEDGNHRPWFCGFDSFAANAMNDWRKQCREWEGDCESNLMQSFIGKLPGMAARLSLIFSGLAYAFDDHPEPATQNITMDQFGRACHTLEAFFLPMARRAYSAGSSDNDRTARLLLAKIRSSQIKSFTSRDIARKGWSGLAKTAAVEKAARPLEDADILRRVDVPTSSAGGRPTVRFLVNPRAMERDQ